MEYIDIVDENDNPIGEIKEKQQAHEDGNFHRTAHVWIINANNELLLQKRSERNHILIVGIYQEQDISEQEKL